MMKQSKVFVDNGMNQMQDEAVRDFFGKKKEINLTNLKSIKIDKSTRRHKDGKSRITLS